MTREGVGMGEGFGVERIRPVDQTAKPGPQGKRTYSLRLLMVLTEWVGSQNVRPAADVELASVELADTEIQGFIAEAAGWAQSGLKARVAMEPPPPQ